MPRPVRQAGGLSIATWPLGLAAAAPALLTALALLISAGQLPRLPRLPATLALGVVLLLLAGTTAWAYYLHYPAWTHPAVALLPTVALFLPAALIRGQVVTRINGDPAMIVYVPFAIAWLLLLAATIVSGTIALAVAQHAPSFASLGLLPIILFQVWTFVLAPPLLETHVYRALATALVLAALATFCAWIATPAQRPLIALGAIALQLGQLWYIRQPWPPLQGMLRMTMVLDVLLFLGLLGLVAAAPLIAAWVRHSGGPVARRLLGAEWRTG